jgi:hypothetical protein
MIKEITECLDVTVRINFPYVGNLFQSNSLLTLHNTLSSPSLTTLHNEVGPGGGCAPPYVRRVRVCGTLAFLFLSAPDQSLFGDAPLVCVICALLFSFRHFSVRMTSFPFGFLFQCTLM